MLTGPQHTEKWQNPGSEAAHHGHEWVELAGPQRGRVVVGKEQDEVDDVFHKMLRKAPQQRILRGQEARRVEARVFICCVPSQIHY